MANLNQEVPLDKDFRAINVPLYQKNYNYQNAAEELDPDTGNIQKFSLNPDLSLFLVAQESNPRIHSTLDKLVRILEETLNKNGITNEVHSNSTTARTSGISTKGRTRNG